MTTGELDITTTAGLREHLEQLQRERAAAALAGLDANPLYMRDLADELDAVRDAYIGAAVNEIASLRAALGAPLRG